MKLDVSNDHKTEVVGAASELLHKKEELRAALLLQTRILDALIRDLATKDLEHDEDGRKIRDTTLLMVQALGVSIHSILKLSRQIDMGIRDCFGIARSIAELAVNIAYIAASPKEVAIRCEQHALQKRYRDISRSGSIGGIQISSHGDSTPGVDSVPGLEEALEMFTDKKGREVRDWTPLNIDQRIGIVRSLSEAAALSLSGAIFAIYRHSSELLHGTYFSILYYWQGPSGEKLDRKNFEDRWVNNHFVTIFTAAFFGAAGAIEACSARFTLPHIAGGQRALQKKVYAMVVSVETGAARKS